MSGWLIRSQQMRIEDLERYIEHLEAQVKEYKRALEEKQKGQPERAAP